MLIIASFAVFSAGAILMIAGATLKQPAPFLMGIAVMAFGCFMLGYSTAK